MHRLPLHADNGALRGIEATLIEPVTAKPDAARDRLVKGLRPAAGGRGQLDNVYRARAGLDVLVIGDGNPATMTHGDHRP